MAPQVPRLVEGREFWEALDDLVASSEVTIDRPAGSRHPRFPELIYPLDYGYLQGTVAADGGGVDVWVGTGGAGRVVAVLCSVDLSKQDTELKLVLGCTTEEQDTVLAFHNGEQRRGVLVRRGE